MEPLDPAKNVEGSGYSKRRISSILKAPRKSTIIRDPEQQENEVESAKAVEKRNSRRVSFAPANDVLLFAKDAKNVSPTRSPLQELMTATAATTQTRVQLAVTEDGGQQIMGIENLLSAPLHISQQRDMINVDSGNDGEKTVMFSSEDALMDMTHSHTINIGSDAELLGDTSQNCDFLLAGRERRVAVDDGSTDMSLSHIGNMTSGSVSLSTGRNADLSRVEKKNVSAKVPCLDPGFENFLASISKPSSSSSNAVITKMTPFAGTWSEDTNVSLGLNKTHKDDVDKENQVPKSLNTTKKIGGSFNGSAFCPQDDVSMDITEAQTGRILGMIDDDPFQCLFPTQDMYGHSDKRASQMTEIKRQPSSEALGSADPKGRKSLLNPLLHTHQTPIISSNPKECKEKTIMFTAGDEFMDMTQSHTVRIASGSLAPTQRLDPGFNEFLVSLSKPSETSGNPKSHRSHTAPPSKQGMNTVGSVSQNKTPRAGAGKENWSLNTSRSSGEPLSAGIIGPKGDVSMDMTDVQTGLILGGDVSVNITEAQTGRIRVLTESDDPFQFLVPSQDLHPLCESQKTSEVTSGQQNSKGFRSSTHKDVVMETSLKPSFKTPLKRQQEKLATEDDYREKTVKFSADDACVDVTRSHTINIATDLKTQLTRNGNFSPTRGEKTVMFTVDGAAMDITQCLTVNIASNLMSDSVNSVRKQEGETCGPPSSTHSLDPGYNNLLTSLSKPSDYGVNPEITRMAPTPAQSSNEHTVCPENDISMDMTEAQTGCILGGDISMDMTEAQTGCILGGDISMDMTEVQTGRIVETPGTDDPLQCLLPPEGMYQQSGKLKKTEMTSYQQSSEDLGSSNSQVVGNLLKSSLKTTLQTHQIQFDAEDDCRDKTVRFASDDACMEVTQSLTANIVSNLPLQSYQNADLPANGEKTVRFAAKAAAMDVTRSHTVNIATELDVLSHQNVDLLPASGEKTVRFSANDAAMDVTRSHTVNIATELDVLSHQNVDLLPASGEKTVRFSANDAAMDVTRSHTVNIATELDVLSHQNVDLLPASGEKTVRFSANDAAMDVTRSHTDLNMLSHQNLAFLAANEEKTVRFTAKAAAMDVTQSHTVNIATDLNMLSHQNVNLLPANGEKTVRFMENADGMDVTRSHTVDIATNFESALNQNVDLLPANSEKTGRFTANNTPRDVTQNHSVSNPTNFGLKSNHQNVDFVPTCGEKTVRFTTNDAAMDMTQSLTVNIASTSMSDSFLSHQSAAPIHENISSVSVRKTDSDTCVPHSKRSSSAHGLDPEFKNLLSESGGPWAISKADAADTPFLPESPASNDSLVQLETKEPDTNTEYEAPGLVSAVKEKPVNEMMTDCPEISASMDMTEVQTGCILGQTCTDEPPEGFSSTQDPSSDHFRRTKLTSQNTEALGSSSPDDAEIHNPPCSLDSNETETMKEHEPRTTACPLTQTMESSPNAVDQGVDATRSRTSRRMSLADLQSKVRRLSSMVNTAPDAMAMDSCTAPLPPSDHIATELDMLSNQNLYLLPLSGEKTVRFTVKAAAMDVTQSHTVNIATDLNMLSHQNVNLLPANGEKTVRFTENADGMDVTRSHTVDIATNFESALNQNVDLLPANSEKTGRFTANNTPRDVTQNHSVSNPTNFGLKSNQQNVDFVPTCGEKTVRFTTNDAAMDMTQSLTVNIASTSMSDSFLSHQSAAPIHENISSVSVRKTDSDTCVPHSKRSSSAHGLDPEFKNLLSESGGPWAISKADAADTPFLPESPASNDSLVQLETKEPDTNTEYEAPGLVSAVKEKPVNEMMTDCPEISASMDMTEVQTGCILGQTCTDEPPEGFSSTQDPSSDHFRRTKLTSQNTEALRSSSPDDAEIHNPPRSLDSNETETMKEHEPRTTACPLTQTMESSPNAVDQGVDATRSRTSRRMSLADLQSKVRRLSHMVNTAPDAMAMDSCTAPLPPSDHDLNDNSKDEPTSQPEAEPELEMGLVNTQDNTQAQVITQAEQLSAITPVTPFNLKTKQLMSRLSVGGFKAKLPQRSNIEDSKRVASVGETTRTVTVSVTSQLNNFEDDVSDIYDEELCSYEDVSETLDTRSPAKISEKESPSQEFNMFEPLEEDVYQDDCIGSVHRQKRPLPADGDSKEDEKRLKASTEFVEQALQCDGSMAPAHITTQTMESSSYSHSASRCEAAYESTIKHSLFESQLEDYTSDAQKKLEDGTITVLEFFKLFNIDFVIHNPRQSVVPGRLLSDTDGTPMDLLKDRHISRPKQLVYEADIQTLTEKVEGLKVRMRDLDKHLKAVNRPLWEEMRYSSEKEIKSFGAKLKERNNFFRKTSKVQSHEMKEVLYSNVVRANLEEQQKLRGTVEEADVMIKSLDDCVAELEAELAAVEEKDSEDKPSLKSLQEGMKKVTETLADNDRQITELEMQKKQNSSKLNRLKAETRNLESHMDMLDTLNEWKLREKKDNCTIYTFLHETMFLQLAYEKSTGNDADGGLEQKITNIAFKLELDDEKSQFHAHLVHKLVSQYIQGESAWVEKYPTRRHVPKLLHDVSLVVSRCRLLGEELRLLKMWGGLRLDILHISCMDTRVHIVFSSLKKCSKFEVVFSVSLANQLCGLSVESFNNIIGSTTIQQIEEIVATFTPAKNLLTKIVKKIHNTLLC